MESHVVKILAIEKITHDVIAIKTEKPQGYSFVPGQATEVAINDKHWKDEKRPFTFTSLPGDDHLEFIIKTYPSHNSVTARLLKVKRGDELIVHDVWGAIGYQSKGLFIAGGAGITPFISIFRYLRVINNIEGNRLLFANKTKSDIILKAELEEILGDNFVNILSGEKVPGYKHGFVTEDVLRETSVHPGDLIYLCGPPLMIESVTGTLNKLKIYGQSLIMEV